MEERKTVTILFADLTGSTPLGEQLDPEEVRAIMSRFFAAMSEVIGRHGGVVEKFIGDEVMAVFGLPAAHEDDPERAVRSAQEMHAELDRLNAALTRRGAPALMMRIGINTGPVIANPHAVEKGEFMVTGDAVNVAARLRAAADPGTTVVGEATYRRTEAVAELDALGPLELKGKARPIPAWRLRGLRAEPASPRGVQAPLVGRENELAVLEGLLQRVRRERRPHLVTVLGLPGVGKSRLFDELARRHPEAAVRSGRSLPYGGTTLWAVAEILRADCGILRSDPPDQAAAKLRTRLETLFGTEAAGERSGVLAQLTRVLALGSHSGPGGTAEDARSELFWALRRYVERLAASGPLLLGFEDAHSADDELLDLIEHLTATAEGALLIVCLARPDLFDRRGSWGGGKHNYAALSLEALPDAETERFLSALLAGAPVPDALRGAASVAGGNPLFIEEIVRMLMDRGTLVRRNGGWEVAGRLERLIPDSVQGVITARLDQLPREHKTAALTASVLGKDFWSGALEAVMKRPRDELDRLLTALIAKDFIAERASSRLAGQREFTFTHMLIHDVAYSILPKAVRAEKHRAFGGWLETVLGERATEFADLLAYHWLQAAHLAEQVGSTDEDAARQAIRYALLAGRRAILVSGHEHAMAHFQTARALAEQLGAQADRAAAIEGQADVLALQARWEEASQLYQQALDYHLAQGDPVGQAKVQSRMGSTFSGIFDFRKALPHIQAAMQKLEGRTDEPELANVYVQMARTQAYLGALDEAERSARAGLEIAQRLGLRAVAAEAKGMIGWTRTLLGDPDPPGADGIQEYVNEMVELGDPRRAISALMGRGFRRRVRGDYAGAIDDVRTAMTFAEQSGNRPRVALCLMSLGELHLARGQTHEAVRVYRRYLEAFDDIGSWIEQVRCGLAFAEGAPDVALTWAEPAVQRAAARRDAVTHGVCIDWHARLALLLGQPQRALIAAEGGIAYYAPLRIFWPAYLHPPAAEAALSIGDREAARGHVEQAEAHRWMQLSPALARLARARGLLAGADQRWDAAFAALDEARNSFRTLGQPLDEAQTLGDLARMLRARGGAGDVGEADRAAEEAAAIYRRLGVSPPLSS